MEMAGKMVADKVTAGISDLLQLASDKAIDLMKDEITLRFGWDKEIRKISDMLPEIEAMLDDAEEQQLHSEKVQDWLQQLRGVAYEVDDVLDEIETHAAEMRAEGDTTSTFTKVVSSLLLSTCSPFCSPLGIAAPFQMTRRIRSVRQKLGEIKQQRDSLGIDVGRSKQTTIARETAHIMNADMEVVGREEDVKKIIEKLLMLDHDKPESSLSSSQSKDGHDRVTLVPIVGMGGLGKTTLAQMVFNNEEVQKHFTLKKWLFVGEKFDPRELIEKITEKSLGNLDLVQRQESLIDKLKGERFLIVLDDVWSEKKEEWRQLWDPLTNNKKGSRVIVTTRSRKVVNAISSTSSGQAEQLQILSNDHCWRIFEKCAFMNGNSNASLDLKAIGQKIVEKFKGIPLAAKIVGSSLYGKSRDTWISILEDQAWSRMQEGDEETILPILQLSYQHIPLHLKRCFAFCAIFPKDQLFNKESLVRMWMAQGFLKPLKNKGMGAKRMEDVGNEYFDDLLNRSFFQYVEEKYVMHDLVHDLAQEVSAGECLRIEGKQSFTIPEGIRHLSISYTTGKLKLQNSSNLKTLRTLISNNTIAEFFENPDQLLNQLKCLRVLVLRGNGIQRFPDSFGDLKHLRYLELRYWPDCYMCELPESLCKLYNLQTLLVHGCVCELPTDVSKLVNLRHLRARRGKMAGIEKLTSLQQLRYFYVSGGNKIDALKDLTELRGKLGIMNIRKVRSKEEASEARLESKKHLEGLTLSFRYIPDIDEGLNLLRDIDQRLNFFLDSHREFDEEDLESIFRLEEEDLESDIRLQEEVLEALRPPPNLKSFKIKGYGGTKLPALGHLRLLKKLILDDLPRIKEVGREFYNSGGCGDDDVVFPNLEELRLVNMSSLEEWVVGIQKTRQWFPSLRQLFIQNCPKLTELPPIPPTLTTLTLRNVGLRDPPGLMQGYKDGTDGINSSSSSLSSLQIENCPALTSLSSLLGHHDLSSLEELFIDDSVGELVPLWEKRGMLQNFPSLREIVINDCPNLQSLPEGLHGLSSLKTLELRDCPKIQRLPERGLPPSLEKLIIWRCPMLQERCRRPKMVERPDHSSTTGDSGLDWPKIAHIPKIINEEELQEEDTEKELQNAAENS